jgi:hypothetical protein
MKRILLVCSLISVLILAGCGGGGGNGDGVTLNYIPNFTFGNTSAALVYDSGSSAPFDQEQRQRYIMLSPFLIGFNRNPQKVTNGQSLSYALQNSSTKLGLIASVSGAVVTLTGEVPGNSGNITIAINTNTNTFNYEQLLKIKTSDNSQYANIYIKLNDVTLDENGYYHTPGKAYILGNTFSFMGDMDYYYGKGKVDHEYSDQTHVIIGTYGKQYQPPSTLPLPNPSPSDLTAMSKATLLSYFSDTSGWDPIPDSEMILYYDKTNGYFYTDNKENEINQELILNDATKGRPW